MQRRHEETGAAADAARVEAVPPGPARLGITCASADRGRANGAGGAAEIGSFAGGRGSHSPADSPRAVTRSGGKHAPALNVPGPVRCLAHDLDACLDTGR